MNRRRATVAALCSLPLLVGCREPAPRNNSDEQAVRARQADVLERYSRSAAVRNTIGSYSSLEGMRNMAVRGYGLVVGLGDNGARDCPSRVRRRLAAEIRKKYGFGDSRLGMGQISPEKIIDSPDTAVVMVHGEIGPAALKGTRFDLEVRALPGTETLSLAGGRLYTTDLHYYREAGGGMVQEGKVIASGEGPVFTNPFSSRREETASDGFRRGRVIGGGVSHENRRVRLVLSTPSYARAIQIQNTINDRFGRGDKLATAESPSYVALTVAPRYHGQELEFLAVVRHLYLSNDAGHDDRITLELARELPDLQAPHDSIGLAWEGIGKPVKPVIRDLYEHKLPHVTFYSARTGLRLGDTLALKVLERHALDPQSPYHMDTIRELARATDMVRAADVLRRVVAADVGASARTAAYEGLLAHGDPILSSKAVGGQLVVDHIPSAGSKSMIIAKVSGQPRLAIVGDPRCRTPLFYRHAQGLITMNAEASDRRVTLIRKLPSGQMSPAVAAPRRVYDLACLLGSKASENAQGQVLGLGLSYSQVIDVLSALCEKGICDASFHLERAAAQDVLSPPQRLGRPESEL